MGPPIMPPIMGPARGPYYGSLIRIPQFQKFFNINNSMLSFKKFLIESYLILENKRQDFINRFLKIHSNHPLVEENPELAGSLISHSMSFGQNADEHHFLTRQLLDRTYKPGEDDPTIQMTLSKWRRGKQEGLVQGSLKDHSHSSVYALFRDIPQLSKSSSKAVRAGEEIDKYHIGQIEHPEHGTLDVYHVHHSDIPANYKADPELPVEEEFKKINSALRKSCSRGEYSWCVLPQKTTLNDDTIIPDTGAKMIKHYSQGSGIFFYANEDGKMVLSHGYRDRGVVRPENDVVGEKEESDVISKTLKLLPKEKGFQHGIANFNKLGEEEQIQITKEPSFGTNMSTEENTEHFETAREHFETALKSPHKSVQTAAVEHPRFGTDRNHVWYAFGSKYESIARAGLQHAKFGTDPNHISYALQSPHKSVQTAAVEHPSFGTSRYHIGYALGSIYRSIARAGLQHPSFGTDPNHISNALDSPHEFVARAGLKHPNFGRWHIKDALRSHHEFVVRAASAARERLEREERAARGEPPPPKPGLFGLIGKIFGARAKAVTQDQIREEYKAYLRQKLFEYTLPPQTREEMTGENLEQEGEIHREVDALFQDILHISNNYPDKFTEENILELFGDVAPGTLSSIKPHHINGLDLTDEHEKIFHNALDSHISDGNSAPDDIP